MGVIKLEKEINKEINIELSDCMDLDNTNASNEEKNNKLYIKYEKLGDLYCSLDLYELGLSSYLNQV